MMAFVRFALGVNVALCALCVATGVNAVDELTKGLLWAWVWLLTEAVWDDERERAQ